MTIYRAQHSGFCFGVKRAIKLAQDAKAHYIGKQIFTLGELIHNPQIVHELKNGGIEPANSVDELHDSVVIIRSHGITRSERLELQQNGNVIIDATCPYVARTHELIRDMIREGYQVYIMGDADHPEVIGMLSYGDEHTRVISPREDVCKAKYQKVSLISQTTQKMDDLINLSGKLLNCTKELRIFNTICLATSERQTASLSLASETDLMFVVGGKHSSNTRQLYAICKAQTECYHIEDETEITPEMLIGKETIGITAGASTPDDMIIKVYNQIKEINRDPSFAKSIEEIPLFKEESC